MRKIPTLTAGAAIVALILGALGVSGRERVEAAGRVVGYSHDSHYKAMRLEVGTPPPPPVNSPVIPTDAPAGWHTVFADDFVGSALDRARWFPYSGQAGGDADTTFSPTNVDVSGGHLRIEATPDPDQPGKWITGGVSNAHSLQMTYGEYLVRFRAQQGTGISYALLLWPSDNQSPPEIDFAEDNGADRKTMFSFLHYGADNTQIKSTTRGDFTKWNVAGVKWTPGHIEYTLNGKVWMTIKGDEVPDEPMSLALQAQAWACGASWETCPDASTPSDVQVDVDWVVGYAQTG